VSLLGDTAEEVFIVKSSRKTWSDEEKVRIARRILSGETTITATSKELEAQSYQVAAWVGLEAERQAQQGVRLERAPAAAAPSVPSIESTAGMTESDINAMSADDRVILQLLTKRFLKQLTS
jgi:transposase-like protein